MGTSTKFLKGTLWALIGFIIPQIFNFLLYLVVARVVEQKSFGVLGVITSSVAVFANVAGLGMGRTATYYIARFANTDKIKVANVIVTTYIICIVSSIPFIIGMVVFTRALGVSLLNLVGFETELKLSGLLFLSNLILGLQVSILTGFHKFKETSVLNGIRAILAAILSISTVFTFKILGVVLSFTISAFLTNILASVYLSRTYREREIKLKLKSFHKTFDKTIFSDVSIPNFLTGILVFPIQWVINVIIAHTENGYIYLGMLTGINQIKNILLLISGLFSNVNLPLLASVSAESEKDKIEHEALISANLDITMIFILPVSTIFLFYCSELMRLFGDKYQLASGTLLFVIIGTSVSAIGSPIGTAIQAKGRMWLGFGLNLFWSVIHVLLVYLLWTKLNILSYGISFFVSHLLLFWLGYVIYSGQIGPYVKSKIQLLLFHSVLTLLIALVSYKYQIHILLSFIWAIVTLIVYLKLVSRDVKNNIIKIIRDHFPVYH